MAPEAFPAPMITVRPLGLGGRCAGTQIEGRAASTAALNIALSSSSGFISSQSSPSKPRRTCTDVAKRQANQLQQTKKPGISRPFCRTNDGRGAYTFNV